MELLTLRGKSDGKNIPLGNNFEQDWLPTFLLHLINFFLSIALVKAFATLSLVLKLS